MAKRGPKGPSKYTDEFVDKEADALLAYAENHPTVPFLCEFAPKRGYYSELCHIWADSNEKFFLALKKFKDIQQFALVSAGLASEIHPAFAIFTLKNVAGWRDHPEEAGNSGKKSIIQLFQHIGTNGSNHEEEETNSPGKNSKGSKFLARQPRGLSL